MLENMRILRLSIFLVLIVLGTNANVQLVSDSTEYQNLVEASNKHYFDFVMGHLQKADELGMLKASSECVNTLQKYSQNFTEYGGIIGQMVYNSGKDVNDLGK